MNGYPIVDAGMERVMVNWIYSQYSTDNSCFFFSKHLMIDWRRNFECFYGVLS